MTTLLSGSGRANFRPEIRVNSGLSWSFSRHKLLAFCERAVYWRYFGWRGLGLEPNDPAAGRAFALRWLTSLPLVIGAAVHASARDIVSAIAKDESRPGHDALLHRARLLLNQVWRSSQPDRIDRFWTSPAIHAALREIVYHGALRDSEIDDARRRLRTCLANLCDAPVLTDLGRARESGGLRVGPRRPMLVAVDGAPVWAALDAAYLHRRRPVAGERVPGSRWCIVDFKTGSTDAADERLQLATYALCLLATGVPSSRGVYLGRIVDLRQAADRWYLLGPDDLAAARAVIADDMRRQRRLMRDPDRGIPQPKSRWALAARRSSCSRCNFLELCTEELTPLSRRPRERDVALRVVMPPGAPAPLAAQAAVPLVPAHRTCETDPVHELENRPPLEEVR